MLVVICIVFSGVWYNFTMNEMYNMGLGIHSVGEIVLLAVILGNILYLKMATSLKKYKRVMSVVLVPLTASIIGFAIFTGIIMMAAKHLDFTLENIVMILISLILIFLEVKRIKNLRYVNVNKERALEAYKAFGLKILLLEFLLVLLISLWMWLI